MADNYYNRILFIITEAHMKSSLEPIIKGATDSDLIVDIITFPEKPTLGIGWRIRNGKKYFAKVKEQVRRVATADRLENTLIIYSCAEGFVLSNKNKWLPDLVDSSEVCIMHGFMVTEYSFPKELLRGLINKISILILGFRLIGSGFGGVKTDKIIVYSEMYSQYLQKYRNWKKQNIIVSTTLLKKTFSVKKTTSTKGCLLLLQDFVSINKIEAEVFYNYLNQIITTLSQSFDWVRIRKHPKMDITPYMDIFTIENVSIPVGITSLEEDLQDVSLAVSFYSTALIDAFLANVPVLGIRPKELDIKYYDFINKVVGVEGLESVIKNKFDINEYGINPVYLSKGDLKVDFNLLRKK